jgi:hypothetical protein
MIQFHQSRGRYSGSRTVSEDIQKEPVRRWKPEPLIDDSDDQDLEFRKEPPYPALAIAAGMLWIILGSLAGLSAAMVVFSVFIMGANRGVRLGVEAGSDLSIPAGITFLIAFMLIRIGIQSVRGLVRERLRYGIGSIFFAFLPCLMLIYSASRGGFIEAGIEGLIVAFLLAAGVLSLAGAVQYKAWQKRSTP